MYNSIVNWNYILYVIMYVAICLCNWVSLRVCMSYTYSVYVYVLHGCNNYLFSCITDNYRMAQIFDGGKF